MISRNTISFLLVLGILPIVFSIKCWDCRSNLDPDCGDPFKNTTIAIRDCNEEKRLKNLPGEWSSMCRKISRKVNGSPVIIRGCTWKRQDDDSYTCPSTTKGPNQTFFCETCDDRDGCNGASAVGNTIALILAPLSLLLFKRGLA